MLSRLVLSFLILSAALALPLMEGMKTRNSNLIVVRSPDASNPSAQSCTTFSDCSCPSNADTTTIHSISCINGFCSCDNPVVNQLSNKFIDAVAAVGNAAITKAVGQLMQGLADAKEVAGIIASAVLGPEAKAALKIALNAFPDTGPSHIDQATKAILTQGL